eukprot:7381790-Prymnesium_polylepis.3
MGISDAHKLFKLVWTAVSLLPGGELHGSELLVDVAAFKLKAFYGDVASYYRDGPDGMSSGYKRYLAKVFSALAAATGASENIVAVFDGARFPPKSREHARRGSSRDETLAAAQKADEENKEAEAADLYSKLAYPPPPCVDAWLMAHCKASGIDVVQAPFEADSQAGHMAAQPCSRRRVLVTIDSDLAFYPGVDSVLYLGGQGGLVAHLLRPADLIGQTVGNLDLRGFTLFDLRTVAIAAGCDFCPRVYMNGWKALVDIIRPLQHSWGSPELREAFITRLVAINAAKGDHMHENYEMMLRESYRAFELPVAWAGEGGAHDGWPRGVL